MAYVEAAAVVYLRRIYGISDLLRDIAPYDPRIAAIELGREAATLVMILAAALGVVPASAETLGRLRPTPFNWPVFLAGYLAMIWGVRRADRSATRSPS